MIALLSVLIASLTGSANAPGGGVDVDDRVPAIPRIQLFLSPVGSDAVCALGLRTPCQTFGRALQLARCGDVVEVAGGTYSPSVPLLYNPLLAVTRCKKPVVFRAAKGANPVVGDGTWEWGQCQTFGPPHNLTLDGIDIAGLIDINYCRSGAKRAINLTIQNARFTSHAQHLAAGSVKNFTLRNVEFGPTCCDADSVNIAQGPDYPAEPYPNGVLLDNVYWHDVRNSCADIPASVWPNCSSESSRYAGNHVDCLQTTGIANLTIRNSRFINCQTAVQAHREKGPNYDWLIVNNIFSGRHGFNFGSHGAYYAFEGINPETAKPAFAKFYFNTFAGGFTFDEAHPAGKYEIVGNIFHGFPNSRTCDITHGYGLPPAAWDVKRYNMATREGRACGSTNRTGTPSYVNPKDGGLGPPDYRLRRGSPGIGDGGLRMHPRYDIDGRLRPTRWRSDVGAFQHETAQIVLGRSIGAFRLGMPRAQIEAQNGSPRSVAARKTSRRRAMVAVYRRQGGTVRVTYGERGTAVGLVTSSPYYTTAGGIGVSGSTRLLPRDSRWWPCRRAYRLRRGQVIVQFGVARQRAKTITSVAMTRRRFVRSC